MSANVPGFGNIAEELRRITVQVLSTDSSATGSGVIVGPATVITNAHVTAGPDVRIRTATGELVSATIRKRDRARDLAILHVPRIAGESAGSLRDSSLVQPGEIAIAVGHPMGFIGAVSTGVVRAVAPVPGLGRRRWVQATVRLAPGNSGGPLADIHGRIIGINAMVMNGLGLAVPSDAVQNFLSAPAPVRLGVTVRPARIRDGTQGMLILNIENASPAASASLLPGDLITGIDGVSAADVDSMESALVAAATEHRDKIVVQFRRGGSDRERSATTAVAPAIRAEGQAA